MNMGLWRGFSFEDSGSWEFPEASLTHGLIQPQEKANTEVKLR
jgi:hypothetical protein